MKFEIVGADSEIFKDLTYGEKGRQLSCFVPPEYDWTQLNYGQGEGQVVINNCEWGFYYGDENSLLVILHTGKCRLQEAFDFVSKVGLRVYGNSPHTVVLAGRDQ